METPVKNYIVWMLYCEAYLCGLKSMDGVFRCVSPDAACMKVNLDM